ncbi:MAG: hypothetical protein NTX79_04515 [Candidatus Micrarchaeota archaeon]|nr:hypothetical protein [Candidatus Micrarchaeota archaeon]
MLFDLGNYWVFVALLAIIYVAITTTVQANIGGKNRLKTIQEDMKSVQLQLMEASKSKDTAASDAVMKKYWELTGELMKVQFQMLAVLLVILFVFMAIFPHFEPGAEDDIRAQLFDDGLAAHCDLLSSDGVFSNCFAIPANASTGAWVADANLYSAANESLAKNGTALYVEKGEPQDIWVQASSQSGFLDGLLGKTAYHINATADAQNVTRGQTVALHAAVSPALPAGDRLEGSLDMGTFYYVDLPFTIPLINIRRIIGSYGVFLFAAFVISILYSIGKAVYSAAMKKSK